MNFLRNNILNNIHKICPTRTWKGKQLKYNNQKVKKQLAKDFNNSCGYCGDSHYYVGGRNYFHVDHFAPKSLFKELEDSYDNFVYSCPYCNSSKSNCWIGKTPQENVINNKGFIDPCSEEYSLHLGRNKDGSIYYKTILGEFIFNTLKLYLIRHKILYQLDELSNKIELLEEKKSKSNNKQQIKKLNQMKQRLCEAFYYYFETYKKTIDEC